MGGGLREACVVAMRNYRQIEVIADRSYGYPAAVAVAWARLGDWSRAEFLAAHIGAGRRAYAGMAEVAAARGDAERCLRMVDAVRDPARRGGLDWFTAREHAVAARAAARVGRRDVARDLLRDAETALRRSADATQTDRRAEALATVAQAYAAIGDRRHARKLIAEAEHRLDGLHGDTRAYYLSLIAFASAEVRGVQAAMRSFPDPHFPVYRARVQAGFARAAAEAGDHGTAARLLDSVEGWLLPAVQAQGDVVHGRAELSLREALLALTEVAEVAVRAGDPQRARGHLAAVDAVVRRLGYPQTQQQLYTRLAIVHELLGSPAAAVTLVEHVTAPDARLAILTQMAVAAAEAGREERAGALFDQADALAREMRRPRRQQDEPRLDLAVALAEAGRPEPAERILLAMSRPRQPFWELVALSTAVAEVDRLDQAQPLLALAGEDESLRERMLPALAEAAGRTDRLSLMDDLVEPDQHAPFLRKAAIGAAGAGRFETALELFTRAAELDRVAPSTRGAWVLGPDPATRIAVLALRAGSPLVDDFCRLARPPERAHWKMPDLDAIRGDLEAVVRQVTAEDPPIADAVAKVAPVVAARGRTDLVGTLLALGVQASLNWTRAVPAAINRDLATLAVAAAELDQPERADAILQRLADADTHPDDRAPALAARAQAYARAGDTARAQEVVDEAFACLLSRAGGSGAERALAACVRAGVALDPQRCRAILADALATQPVDTPKFLAAVPLADPALADLVVALMAGHDSG
ncbi:hypothetical protein ACFO1B_16090 [Dactylosporangium siamense]|uniref:Tetratricopeptide repeat protein n=1 Tax=Dactylosporangium siamense TaxID=685454 RepID=A0A919PID5_9ACTN|nr:hypothetical protein [Dactylosporangium siamense]GIG45361.1 hypothetical protein Dsi01nite_034020 [Dactylosporangium siamense]